MKKVLSIFILVFFSGIYLVSSVNPIMKKITSYRIEMQSLFGSDKYRYGDLYGFSYLKDYKIPRENKPPVLSDCNKPGIVNLYLIPDSFFWDFFETDSIFCNINKFKHRAFYNEKIEEQLDSTKKNILIIEVTERFIRKLFSDTLELYTSLNVYRNTPNLKWRHQPEKLWDRIERILFNKTIERNIDFNLFEYSFLTPIKELKAELNYRVFNRTDKEVSVSTDKKYLFYRETTDSAKITSSFNYIGEKDFSELVNSINGAYKHFREVGFDEVYLSIIPNPVTIIEPGFGRYNDLINRIQNRKDLVIPFIDVYSIFKTTPYEIYKRSDSHWNSEGFQIWVNEVNKILKQYSH